MTEQEALAEDVKRQLRQLIANGMQQQAKEILPQVLQLLPGDKELEEIEKQLSE
jgi:hypothetical protein